MYLSAKSSCPLDGKCLTKCVVYKAKITEATSNNQETYIGLTENEFKTRFNLHKSSFKLENKRTSTTLSDHVWKFENKDINFNIKWEVFKKVKPFAPSDKVCLQEKLSLLRSAPYLNIRSEIFGHCMHRKRFLLNNTNNALSTDEVSIIDRNSRVLTEKLSAKYLLCRYMHVLLFYDLGTNPINFHILCI